jgi:hypothetical protein
MTEIAIKNTDDLVDHVARLVTGAKEYLDEQSKARQQAMEYYAGEMKDLPVPEGQQRSAVVSMDVRAVIKKVMPSIMRTLLSGGKVVKYMPVGPDDEEGAAQATDYVNHVILEEAQVEKALYDAIHDALLLKTGILKWCAYRKTKVTIQEYTDQPDSAVIGLFDDPEIEIIDFSAEPETDADVLALYPGAMRNSFKLRRVRRTVTPKLEAIPRGQFLITPGADSIEDAELVGEEQHLTRSQLVAMGYDKDKVWELAAFDLPHEDSDSRMGDDYTESRTHTRKALEMVRVYEVYVRVDLDDDGEAEIYRIMYGDGGNATGQERQSLSYVMLSMEAVDHAPYSDVVMERDPHQFEGHSIFEDMRMVQRVKSSLMRSVMDNLFQQNNMRALVDPRAVSNPDDIMTLGKTLILAPGARAEDAVNWQSVPFVADKAREFLDYMDEVAKDRTGITDASGGLDPANLPNTSATAAVMMAESGIAQADAIVRSLANGGIRRAFRGLLRLIIAHSDGPRTVQIRGEWVEYDPKVWNADMDCTVNVGLGGGTKERDLAVLQLIYGMQKEILLTIGPENPFVKPKQFYNTLEKITETAGFPSALPFFTEPDEAEVKRLLDEQKQQPNPEVEKIKAQGEVQMQVEQMKAQTTLQLEQGKLQVQAQAEQMKADVARDKEMAQAQADLTVRRQEAELTAQLKAQEIAANERIEGARMQLQREQMMQDREIALLQISAHARQAEMARETATETAE